MNKAQELAAQINEATVALFYPNHAGKPLRYWVAQAQEAMSHAEQINMSVEGMERVEYAFAAFKTQYEGL